MMMIHVQQQQQRRRRRRNAGLLSSSLWMSRIRGSAGWWSIEVLFPLAILFLWMSSSFSVNVVLVVDAVDVVVDPTTDTVVTMAEEPLTSTEKISETNADTRGQQQEESQKQQRTWGTPLDEDIMEEVAAAAAQQDPQQQQLHNVVHVSDDESQQQADGQEEDDELTSSTSRGKGGVWGGSATASTEDPTTAAAEAAETTSNNNSVEDADDSHVSYERPPGGAVADRVHHQRKNIPQKKVPQKDSEDSLPTDSGAMEDVQQTTATSTTNHDDLPQEEVATEANKEETSSTKRERNVKVPDSGGSKRPTVGWQRGSSSSSTTATQTQHYDDHKETIMGSSDKQHSDPHIPFVPPSKQHHQQQQQYYEPPEGFTLAARVYLDETDKLAHFDVVDNNNINNNNECPISLPFFDCGAAGSTTAPLPVKNAYFRHSLSAPTVWKDTDNNLHPVLAVALSDFTMELDSGERQDFKAGDVILLEDCLRPGHTIKHHMNSNSLTVLFLTLPQQYYHTGKKHLSIKRAITQLPAHVPCPDDPFGNHTKAQPRTTTAAAARQTTLDGRRLRLWMLGTISLSLTTLMADFLGKTAPLWLAVGVGGTCFVVGATYGLTVAADAAWSWLELGMERRRIRSTSTNAAAAATNNNTQDQHR